MKDGYSRIRSKGWVGMASAAMALCWSGAGLAQGAGTDPSGEYVATLKSCQSLADDRERLACFDRAVGEIVSANDAGEVRIIDRDDIRETRRQLFGLSVPDVGVLQRDENEEKEEDNGLFETSIASVTYFSERKFRFTTAEGAVWEVNNAPRTLRRVEAGHRVVFKNAALGYYFARINGQTGVKSRRTQ